MRIQLGATVRTSDGHRAGEVSKVVWDPERGEIRDFVVSTGGLTGRDVMISRETLERGASKGADLVIALTKSELDGLGRYEEHAYAPPPYGWLLPAESTYAADAYLFPVVADGPKPTNAAAPRPPLIKKGMRVLDAAGQKIGEVQELRVDDMTGELRGIVVGESEDAREIAADQLDIGGDEVHVIEGSTAKRLP